MHTESSPAEELTSNLLGMSGTAHVNSSISHSVLLIFNIQESKFNRKQFFQAVPHQFTVSHVLMQLGDGNLAQFKSTQA